MLKRPLIFLVAMSVAMPALAASPVAESDLPAIFKKEPPYMQNQICGELMADMSRMSAELYRATGVPKVREAAVLTGTRSVVFVRANAALTKTERGRALSIAKQLEKNTTAAKPTMLPLRFCEERVQRWLKEGIVTQADVKQTEKDVRTALDKAIPPAKQ